MKTALALLLASALVARVSGSTDSSVLENVYSANTRMNPSLQRDSRMEELAKSHGCVSGHSQHQGSWQDKEILHKYSNLGYNIACTSASYHNDRNAQGWRNSPLHLKNIRNNNRVGCSAPTNCDCTFCYYANNA